MERNNLIARLLRAGSGKSQEQLADDTGLHPVTVANIERGLDRPETQTLDQIAAGVSLTTDDGEELLRLYESLQRRRLRPGRDVDDLLAGLVEDLRNRSRLLMERLRRLPLPGEAPSPEDRSAAIERMAVLRTLDEPTRLLLVKVDEDFRTWALAEQAAQASAAADDLREARAWARLAVEIARTIRGSDAWRNRVQGFTLAQEARVLKAAEDRTAAAVMEEAGKLWNAGEDPGGLLAL
ncbi:MAG: helix-turn-helix transcriptional regulator [Acidobacteriota bacterium]